MLEMWLNPQLSSKNMWHIFFAQAFGEVFYERREEFTHSLNKWTNGCYCLLDECIWPIEYCLLDIEATGKWMSSDAELSHGLSVLNDARLSRVENSSTWISLDMSSNEAITLGNEACNSCISHGQSSADMI
ncbi:hypothetical protein BC332_25540 [Capsicum chinense]|nr:hypothetical protein BC332_25540 [Capsicum chinense]